MRFSSHNALFSNSLAAVQQSTDPLNPPGRTGRYLIPAAAAAHLHDVDDAAKALRSRLMKVEVIPQRQGSR